MKLYALDQISGLDRVLVGDKAWTLSRLLQQGYPVLTGWVLGSSVFREFLENLGASHSWLTDFPNSSLHINPDDAHALQIVAQQAKQAIAQATLPESWLKAIAGTIAPGQTSAFLFRASVGSLSQTISPPRGLISARLGWSQPGAIATALKALWADFFSATNLYVWQHQRISLENLNLAVLIQPVQNALVTGSARFETQQIEIEATGGLGQSLVKGEVQPDHYLLERHSGNMISQQLGRKMQLYRLPTLAEYSQAGTTPSTLLETLPSGSTARKTLVLVTDYLSESQLQQYALNDSQLQELMSLLQQLDHDCPGLQHLEWLFALSDQGKSASLLITQCDFNHHQRNTVIQFGQSEWSFVTQGRAAAPGIVIAPAYLLTEVSRTNDPKLQGKILVAQQIEPAWLPSLKQVAGIVTQQEGLTSHAAIIARELGIPAIVGVGIGMEQIQVDAVLRLDGDIGNLYRLNSLASTAPLTETTPLRSTKVQPNITPTAPLTVSVRAENQASQPHLPLSTKLMVNLSQVSALARIINLPIDGIGLLRSELMLLDELGIQTIQEWLQPSYRQQFVTRLAALLRPFVVALSPRPVYYRFLDPRIIHASSVSSLDSDGLPTNLPTLESDRLRQAVLLAELDAIERLASEGFQNLQLILPLVRSLSEFQYFQQHVQQRVNHWGLSSSGTYQCWIMAEVPSVIFMLEAYKQLGLQGISIGTNDLTQLLLGVTRSQLNSHSEFNAYHAAVQIAMQQLIITASSLNLPCSICGQAPVDFPDLIGPLLQWGIQTISVEPGAIESTYQAIALEEQRGSSLPSTKRK